jgi:flagellar basal-body rod protein FlgF
MTKGVYSAASAMQVSQQWLDVIANNLANVSTAGYKRDGVALGETGVEAAYAPGQQAAPTGTLGRRASVLGRFVDHSPGQLVPTGNPLDLALDVPDAYFAVQAGAGVAYTRAGSFRLSASGTLVDGSGRPVLDARLEPISLGPGPVEVAADGTLSQGGARVAKLGLFAGRLEKAGGGLYFGNAEPADVRVHSGYIESSNVNAIEEMVAMIRLNRVFEMAQKSVQGQDESMQRLIQSAQER